MRSDHGKLNIARCSVAHFSVTPSGKRNPALPTAARTLAAEGLGQHRILEQVGGVFDTVSLGTPAPILGAKRSRRHRQMHVRVTIETARMRLQHCHCTRVQVLLVLAEGTDRRPVVAPHFGGARPGESRCRGGIVTSAARIVQAARFAAEKHKDQRRKDADASPYINHPLALASVLALEGGVDDTDVICAALLHDTIEDTQTTAAELAAIFGDKVTGIVLEVSDDKSLAKALRKEAQVRDAPHLSPEAKLVKLADKICNLRDILNSPPADWSPERKREYFDWAARVVAGLRGTHAGLERIFDETYARRVELGTSC